MLTLGGANKLLLIKSPAYSFSGTRIVISTKCAVVNVNSRANNRNLIERIRERITYDDKVEIMSPSAYDTAWVAMVPAMEYSGDGDSDRRPCFPQCLDWIMENQNPDGSWGLGTDHPFLVKDCLSCTLACVLALRKWGVGQQLVQDGMDFIASNGWAASNNNDQFSPVGFDIIFPWNLDGKLCKRVGFISALEPYFICWFIASHSRFGNSQNVQVYALEGLGKSCNWKGVISEHQRSNGSVFNSPATTAAALIHSRDEKCFEYLISVLKASNGRVPTIYPMNIYTRLCMVDTLERLGVSKYFEFELRNILDEIHMRWLEKDDEIFSDITCHAMAFRLLRTHGYDVSSDELTEYVDEEHLIINTVSMQYDGVTTVLELYRASQARICDESILDKIHDWTSAFLKQQLLNQSILDKRLRKQVRKSCSCEFHGTLDQFGVRRSVELYDARDFRILTTAYRCPTVHNEDFVRLSVEDYGISQAQYQKELQQMERWYVEFRLDRLNQGRNVLQVSYSLIAAVIVDPELNMARISYVKAIVLITLFDDFFDRYGSREEALRVIELVRKWNVHAETSYCSREVEILFTALYNTVNEVAENAYVAQGYWIKEDLVSRWLDLLENFARENESWSNETNVAMSLDDYLSFAWKSIGGKICVFTPTPFLGIKIPQEMFKSAEFDSLSEYTGLVCRLLNDLKTFKKERDEGTLNGVTLQIVGGVSEEEAILKVEEIIEYNRRKVLQMVYRREGSIVPRECKELFLKTSKMAYCLYPYNGGDEYSSPNLIMKDIKAMIWEPLELPNLST